MLSHTAGKGPVSKCPDLLRSCAHPVTPSGLDHPVISVGDLQMQRGTLSCLGMPVAAPAAVVDISLLMSTVRLSSQCSACSLPGNHEKLEGEARLMTVTGLGSVIH